jgi:hypothetical protein
MTRKFGLRLHGESDRAKATRKYNDALPGFILTRRVPVLRAGGETYLWMPASSGGENVWRHVLIVGTSPDGTRKRIALKAGISKNSTSHSAQAPGNNVSHPAKPLKNCIN